MLNHNNPFHSSVARMFFFR